LHFFYDSFERKAVREIGREDDVIAIQPLSDEGAGSSLPPRCSGSAFFLPESRRE